MIRLIQLFISIVERLRDLPPLILRAVLCYGFYGPAMEKASNIDNVISWFREDLHIPAPELNAYMSVATECSGVVLLALGLATRLITIPLTVVMIVAIATVHYQNGFSCGRNGFEVPFYYMCMLFTLLVVGPGRISVDHFLKRKFSRGES